VLWRMVMLAIGDSVFAIYGIRRGSKTRDAGTRLHTHHETEGRAGNDAHGSQGRGRRQKTRVPREVTFQTKPAIANPLMFALPVITRRGPDPRVPGFRWKPEVAP